MIKRISHSICIALCLCMLSFCTACSDDEETGTGFLFTGTLSENPECLDPQYTDNENADIIIANIMEGLLRLDRNGVPQEAGAKNYTVSDDGLFYMFNLREDCFWYRDGMEEGAEIPVTADDYVYAFRRLLDPATKSPYADDFSCIKNAAGIMAGALGVEALGVSAPDASTVVFQLEYTNAEFLQLLAQPCAMPCNEEFFLSTNGRYGLSAETILCNGPFYMTKWNYDVYGNDNFMNFRKNALYYDVDNIAPSSLAFTITKSRENSEKDFAEGNSDLLITDSNSMKYLESKNYEVISDYAQTLGLIFNPAHEDEATQEILNHQKLRLALAYSIDRRAYSAVLSEDMKAAYGIIPPAADLLGSSYREMNADEPLPLPYDPAQAAALFEEAAKELKLNSLNSIRILVPTTITDTDALLTICQEWQTLFGQYIGIETVAPAEYDKRLASGDYTIALYSIHAERNSCYAVLRQFEKHKELLGFESEAYTGMMAELAGADKLSKTVELYGMTERAILDTNTFIPLFYKNNYLIYTADNADLAFDAFSGVVDFRYAKHFSK